jgi:hypothetical protein
MMVDTRQMFFTSGHFPVDLVILALVAAFLVLRLRSVLGKKVGLQAPPLPIVPRPDMLARVVDARLKRSSLSRSHMTFQPPARG